MTARVAIVGGGIFGLTLSYYLQKRNIAVDLYEASANLGGVLQTKKTSGYILEEGPNTVLLNEEARSLISELNLDNQVIEINIKEQNKYFATFREKHISLEKVPSSLKEFYKTPLLSTSAKIKVLTEFLRPKCNIKNPSVRDFFSYRLGKEFSEVFISAMLNGIWAGDINKLSIQEVFPELYKLEQSYGSISIAKIISSFSKQKTKKSFFSFEEGLDTLVNKLQEKLDKEQIYLNSEVIKIEELKEGLRLSFKSSGEIQTNYYDKVILNTSFKNSINLLPSSRQEKLKDLSIEYAPLSIAHFSVNSSEMKELKGFGFLAPRNKVSPLLGVIFNSSIFPNRAPQGKFLLTAFIGGSEHSEESDFSQEVVKNATISAIKESLKLQSYPQLLNFKYHSQAIPQFNLNHIELKNRIMNFNRENKIHLLGNWLKGISVSDRIKEAAETAKSFV